MDSAAWQQLWPHYLSAWPWLKGSATPEFVGLVEEYEGISNRSEKIESFWESDFWEWLKANMRQACNGLCACGNRVYALHHKKKKNYFEPTPDRLEYVCGDCHDKKHWRGKHAPGKAKMKTRFDEDSFEGKVKTEYRKGGEVHTKVGAWGKAKREKLKKLGEIGDEAKAYFEPLGYPKMANYSSAIGHVLTDLGLNDTRRQVPNRKKKGKNVLVASGAQVNDGLLPGMQDTKVPEPKVTEPKVTPQPSESRTPRVAMMSIGNICKDIKAATGGGKLKFTPDGGYEIDF